MDTINPNLPLEESETEGTAGARGEDERALRPRDLVRQAQLAAIARFSVGLAHELRNPLTVIRNAVYVIKRKLAQGETAQVPDYLGMIERELSAADRMIAEWASMARGEPPRREAVELDELASAARDRLPPELPVQWRREGPALTLHVDRDQFIQVFRNLFRNAVQAMGGQGGSVCVISHRGDEADEIRVSDTGPGIPPELAEKVFEPLYTTRRSGTGMGLTICRQIVERHGGTLTVEPNAPGAVFCIRLPRTTLDRP